MYLGLSLLLLALGAILTFAVEITVAGLNLNAVGVILMIVGALGLVISLFRMASWGPGGDRPTETRRTVTREDRL